MNTFNRFTKVSIDQPFTTTAPAGRYFVGDPCYAVWNYWWDDLLKVILNEPAYNDPECDERLFLHVTSADGEFVIVDSGGDGVFYDQRRVQHAVDSGTLGLVPAAIALKREKRQRLEDLGQLVTFDEPVTIKASPRYGRLEIGHIKIQA